MSFAISVILKTTILLACASLIALGLRRASASAKHAVWAIALLGALVVPIATAVLPEVNLAVLPEERLSEVRVPGLATRGMRDIQGLTTPSAPAAQPPLLLQGGDKTNDGVEDGLL